MAKTWIAGTVFGVAILVAAHSSAPSAAPAPAPAPVKTGERWEYCELAAPLRRTTAAPGVVGRVNQAVRWATAEEEIEATSWEDLAGRMKVPDAKKGGTEAAQRLRVLNHLGSQGWEMVSFNQPSTAAQAMWAFKRKVGK